MTNRSEKLHKNSLKYRPDIDGLRAIAVLPVLFFHASLGFPGGFVGVDVFFVISGFLIGTLVIAELEAGTFQLFQFWERRVRRLFPALAVVVIACFIAGAIWFVPKNFEELGQSIIAQPLLVSNFYFWRQSGYFETAAEFQPLLHTWSLAVEEQFYLFFPPIMLLLLKGGRKVATTGIIAFIFGSFVWSVYGSYRYPSPTFFLIPARIWELDIGVLLALLPKARKSWPGLNEILGWLGLVLIFWSVFFFSINTRFPGAAALPPCLGAALIIYANSGKMTSVGKLLSWPGFVFTGKISYSLYLWHWPLIVFIKYLVLTDLPDFYLPLALVASFVLAWLNWKFVETPFRKKTILPDRRRLFMVSGVLSVVFVVVGTYLYKADGIPSRFPPEVTKHRKEKHNFPGNDGLENLSRTGELYVIGDRTKNETPPQILLWGDSHAMSVIPVIDKMGKDYGIGAYTAVKPGTLPLIGAHRAEEGSRAPDLGTPVFEFINKHKIKNVLLVARWSVYVNGLPSGKLSTLISDSETESKNPGQAEVVFVRNLRKTVARLRKNEVNVFIMRSVAFQPRDVPVTVALTASRGMDLNLFARPISELRVWHEKANGLIDEAVKGLGATVLDPIPYYTDSSGTYLMAKDGNALYEDRDHLSPIGSLELRPLFDPIFQSAIKETQAGSSKP